MKRPQRRQQSKQQSAVPNDPLFKHTPFPDPGQAVESGEPTLTGDEVERAAALPQTPPEPDEGAHWESGQR